MSQVFKLDCFGRLCKVVYGGAESDVLVWIVDSMEYVEGKYVKCKERMDQGLGLHARDPGDDKQSGHKCTVLQCCGVVFGNDLYSDETRKMIIKSIFVLLCMISGYTKG